MNRATAAGTKVTDRIIAPSSASTTVSAMGWNMRPSTPVSAKMGRYTTMMMSWPNSSGRRASRGGEDLVEAFAAGQRPALMGLGMAQPPHAVLHDHDRAVDDDAEVQRAQAHEVGADLVRDHARKGEQHGQRDDHGRDQRRPDVAQEQEQDHDDQRGAFQQVLLDGGDGLVHQIAAVVDRDQLHALGQRLADGGNAVGHGQRYGPAVLADQHEGRAQHHFLAIVGGRAGAQLAADGHLGHVAHADGLAVHGGEQHVADIVDRLDLSRRPDQVLLALALDVAGADVGVVAVQRRHDVGQRQAIGRQLLGVRRHQVFLA